jgi:HK97 family phage major capsid protein
MSKLKELREQRRKVYEQSVEVMKLELTPENRTKLAAMHGEVEQLGNDIKMIERQDALEAEMRASANDPTGKNVGGSGDNRSADDIKKEYRGAFMEYLTRGDAARNPKGSVLGGTTESRLEVLNNVMRDFRKCQTREQRDQLAGTQAITYTEGAAGGYFVPAGFVYDVEQATKFYAQLLDGQTVRVMETATGNVLPYPTSNDTNQAWTIVGEAQQVTDQGSSANYPTPGTAPSGQPGNVLLSQIQFNAYKGTTGLIRVSLELLQDSAFNIENFLIEQFATRLGRGYEYYLTHGTGGGVQPTGILPAIAASGATPVTAAGSSANDGSANTGANSIGYADIINLIHSVDPTYRRNAKLMFHDTTLRFLKTLLDKFGRPLWVPGVDKDEPDTLCGYQYVINQSFPSIAASATTVAFGQWSKYMVRKVRDLQVLRLDERFADFGEVAYIGFSRLDANLLDAGTHPLNVLVQHS